MRLLLFRNFESSPLTQSLFAQQVQSRISLLSEISNEKIRSQKLRAYYDALFDFATYACPISG